MCFDHGVSDQNSVSGEWYTPPPLIKRIKKVLGPIDYDPWSCAAANEIVGAESYSSIDNRVPWPTNAAVTVLVNPPSGQGYRGYPQYAWRQLIKRRTQLRLRHAIFVGFNISILRTAQTEGVPGPLNFPLCVPRKRIEFIDGETGEAGQAPTRDNVIIYVPGSEDKTALFERVFSRLGDTCQ